jgi:hypothetical protein
MKEKILKVTQRKSRKRIKKTQSSHIYWYTKEEKFRKSETRYDTVIDIIIGHR